MDDHHLASQLLDLERLRIDPGLDAPHFGRRRRHPFQSGQVESLTDHFGECGSLSIVQHGDDRFILPGRTFAAKHALLLRGNGGGGRFGPLRITLRIFLDLGDPRDLGVR